MLCSTSVAQRCLTGVHSPVTKKNNSNSLKLYLIKNIVITDAQASVLKLCEYKCKRQSITHFRTFAALKIHA